MVQQHAPAQPRRRHRAFFGVAGAALQRNALADGEARAYRRRVDARLRRGVARVDPLRGAGDAAFAVVHCEPGGVGAGGVLVARAYAARVRRAVAKVPVVRQRVAVGVAAARRAEAHRQRRRAIRRAGADRRAGRAVLRGGRGNAADLASGGVGGVKQRLAAVVWPEQQRGGAVGAHAGGKVAGDVAVALRLQRDDLAAYVVGEQVGALVLRRPRARRHKRAAGDRAAGAVVVLVDRVDHVWRRGATLAAGAVGVRGLLAVPAVVGAALALVDLFPRVLADVVDEELAAARPEGEAERVAQPPGERLLADIRGGGAAVGIAARSARALKRVVGRDAAVARDPQDLAQQDEAVARGVVRPGAAAVAGVVGAAVADADVQVAIRAKVQVAAVVVAIGRGDVVDQDRLAAGDVRVREGVARDAVHRHLRVGRLAGGAHAELFVGVVQVDGVVAGEVRVDGYAQQAALGVGAHPVANRQVERGLAEQLAVLDDAQLAALRGHQHARGRDERNCGGRGHAGHQRVGEARRHGRGCCRSGNGRGRHEGQQQRAPGAQRSE